MNARKLKEKTRRCFTHTAEKATELFLIKSDVFIRVEEAMK